MHIKGQIQMDIPKFRVWDKRNQTWATDFTISLDGRLLCDDGTTGFIRDDFELMQFTGLKDSNGIEIFESDIVEFTCQCGADCPIYKSTVVKKNGAYLLNLKTRDYIELLPIYMLTKRYHSEVVGNIYQSTWDVETNIIQFKNR